MPPLTENEKAQVRSAAGLSEQQHLPRYLDEPTIGPHGSGWIVVLNNEQRGPVFATLDEAKTFANDLKGKARLRSLAGL